jgi:hypothetical protein
LLATPDAQWPPQLPVLAAELTLAPLWTWAQDGKNYRGLAATFPTAMGTQVQVAMAIDSEHHDAFLRAFSAACGCLWLARPCSWGCWVGLPRAGVLRRCAPCVNRRPG